VALTPPEIIIFPDPVILLPLRSKLPPSCGVVSFTISNKPFPPKPNPEKSTH